MYIFPQNKINHFRVVSSVVFSAFAMCIHYCQFQIISITPKLKLLSSFPPLSTQSLAITHQLVLYIQCWSSELATGSHRLSDLIEISHSSKGQNSKIKLSTDLVSLEASFPLFAIVFLLYSQYGPFLVSKHSWYLFSQENTYLIGALPLRLYLILFTFSRTLSPHSLTLGAEALSFVFCGGSSIQYITFYPLAPQYSCPHIQDIKCIYHISAAPKVLTYSSINSKASKYLKLSLGETRSRIHPEAGL